MVLLLGSCAQGEPTRLTAETACALSSDFVAQLLTVLDQLGGFGGSPVEVDAADTGATIQITQVSCSGFHARPAKGEASITLTLDYLLHGAPLDAPVDYACELVRAEQGWQVRTCR